LGFLDWGRSESSLERAVEAVAVSPSSMMMLCGAASAVPLAVDSRRAASGPRTRS
jgi:hypothetical protein